MSLNSKIKKLFLYDMLSFVIPKISITNKHGIIDFSEFKWCTLPINSDIPNDLLDITHPSVIYLKNKWNGFTHWMAASPYPQSLLRGDVFENTFIFKANLDENKLHPIYFTPICGNPIIEKEDAQYNSDPELFYDDSSNKLYCLTRKRNGDNYKTKIVIQSSKDGKTWSEPTSIFQSSSKDHSLSPCLIKIDRKYKMYLFQIDNFKNTTFLDIFESESLENPNFVKLKSQKWESKTNVWHGGLFTYNNTIYLIFCGHRLNNKYYFGIKDKSKYLWLAKSGDGENFEVFDKALLKMNGVYRSSAFVDEKGQLVCYVSLHNRYKKEKKKYASGNRIGKFEYPFHKLLIELH